MLKDSRSSVSPKRILWLAYLGCLLLGGCAVDPEDKAFYYSGWLRPTDADRERQPHDEMVSEGPHTAYKKDPLIDE